MPKTFEEYKDGVRTLVGKAFNDQNLLAGRPLQNYANMGPVTEVFVSLFADLKFENVKLQRRVDDLEKK